MGLHTVIIFRPVCWLPIDESSCESFLFAMNTSNSEHDVVFRALDYISFRWFWIFVNANLVHKFPITDEGYNHVEEGALNVKQGYPCRSYAVAWVPFHLDRRGLSETPLNRIWQFDGLSASTMLF